VTDPRDPFASEREEERPAPTRPYSIAVGILFLVVIGFAAFNLLDDGGSPASGLRNGDPLPKFAAPSATGSLRGDANVSSRACQVKLRDAIRVCDFFDRPLVLVVWFSRCGGHCEPMLDLVERIRGRFPNVGFLGLDTRDSEEEAREAVLENGWRFPMAVDRDGAVGTLYGIKVGPTTYFAYPGGVVAGSAVGELDEQELITRVRSLVRVSERRQRVRAAQERR
jgi:AhpC/TSA family